MNEEEGRKLEGSEDRKKRNSLLPCGEKWMGEKIPKMIPRFSLVRWLTWRVRGLIKMIQIRTDIGYT